MSLSYPPLNDMTDQKIQEWVNGAVLRINQLEKEVETLWRANELVGKMLFILACAQGIELPEE